MTDSVVISQTSPARRADDTPSREWPWLFDGWVDFATIAVDGTVPAVQRDAASGRSSIDQRGLRLRFDPARTNHFVDADGITLCTGAPSIEARATAADARAIAQAYRERGDAAWAALRGRFAVVHIDLRRRAIFLVTDRFGVIPVCHARSRAALWFSDRADVVAQHVDARPNPQAIYDYLYFHVIPAPRTIFAGVERLPPARVLRFDITGVQELDAWRPHFNVHSSADLSALSTRFKSLLETAVQRQLGGGAVVGSFLSGGTDSSTVAGMIGRTTSRPAATFSIGFADEGYDEMAYARIAARHFGADHHEYYVTPEDLLQNIPGVAAHYDQPFGNSSALPAFSCAGMARSHGIEKMLAGDGGDELFGGNTRYAKQKVFEVYYQVPEAVRKHLVEPALVGASLPRRIPLVRKLASYVEQARVPMPDRTQTYNLLERFGASAVFTPELLASVDVQQPMALQRAVYAASAGAPFVDRMLAFDWRFTLADTDLPKVTGTTQMAGVDVGFPLLDDDLLDFSLTLPASLKVRGLTLRWFFKEALKDFLPMEIIRKKKHGFGLPFGPWLVRNNDLRRFAQTSIDRLVERGIIRGAFRNDLFSTRLSEHAGYYGEMVWILMMLEQWLTAHAPEYALRPA